MIDSMKLDMKVQESWEKICDVLRTSVAGQDPHLSVRAYKGLFHALYESTQGLAQFYPHKKSIAVVKGGSPYFDALLPHFYKQAYQVQVLKRSEILKNPQWVQALNKDTLFVLYCEDHAVTGEILADSHFDQTIHNAKIISVQISHHNFLQRPESVAISPFAVQIRSMDSDLAVSISGSRAKMNVLMTSQMHWDFDTTVSQFAKCHRPPLISKDLVIEVESDAQAYGAFLQTDQRIYDRAVIYSDKVNASAWMDLLCEKLKHAVELPGHEKLIETTNLCRWQGINHYDWWSEIPPTQEQLRGMLIISTALLSEPKLKSYLSESLQELLKMQRG